MRFYQELDCKCSKEIKIKEEKICFCCKNPITEKNLSTYSNDKLFFCNECVNKYFRICCECGEKHYYLFMHNSVNYNDFICKICYEKKYCNCRGCGHNIKKEFAKNMGKYYVCDKCYPKYFVKCSHCKKLINGFESPIRKSPQRKNYCDDCYDTLFRICDSCRQIFNRNRLKIDDSGRHLCLSCFKRNFIVHDYFYLPKLKFSNCKEEKNSLFMGLELEVSKENYKEFLHPKLFLSFLKKLGVYNLYFLKRDSSVSAFEIVSHPFTLKFAKNCMKINKITEWLEKNNYNLDNCGLHIHLDRNYFQETDIIKLRIFFSRFKNELYLISNRDNPSNKYCLYEKYCLKTISNLKNQRGRHCAFNINTNKNTVEVRIFNGTFKYSLILSWLEFCQCLSDFVKNNKLELFSSIKRNESWEAFILASKKYSKLYELLKEKGLIKCV
jgi:hypothetical protein